MDQNMLGDVISAFIKRFFLTISLSRLFEWEGLDENITPTKTNQKNIKTHAIRVHRVRRNSCPFLQNISYENLNAQK